MGELEKISGEKYEEDIAKKVVQSASDAGKLVQTLGQVKEIQNRAEKIHKEEYMENHEIAEDFDEVWNMEYNKSDAFHEYLVNGALLTCTQATMEPFVLTEEESVELFMDSDESEFEFKYGYGRKQTRLNVEENGLYLGRMPYATVKDTVMDVNIIPFRCNCAQKISGDSEIEYIRDHLEDCRANGVCKYLMWLNEEWDNMLLPNTGNAVLPPSYLSISDVKWIKAEDGTMQISVCNSEGITRTSVLFCRRGGLIVPLTSGQENLDTENTFDNLDPSNPDSVKEYVWNYFRDNNFSEAATAAIMGNICAECGFNPEEVSPLNYYGLFQWGGDRRNIFLSQVREWADDEGITDLENAWKNVELQCRFALEEYNNPGNHGWSDRGIDLSVCGEYFDFLCTKERFETTDDPSVAALMWAASFERCYESGHTVSKSDGVYFTEIQDQQKRYEEAAKVYEEFTGRDHG